MTTFLKKGSKTGFMRILIICYLRPHSLLFTRRSIKKRILIGPRPYITLTTPILLTKR